MEGKGKSEREIQSWADDGIESVALRIFWLFFSLLLFPHFFPPHVYFLGLYSLYSRPIDSLVVSDVLLNSIAH